VRVLTILTGTSPLVMHNPQLADPDNSWSRELAPITSKRTKTDDDRWTIYKLKFLGGLYVGRDGIVVPAPNVHKCFVDGATLRKLGKDVGRAVMPLAPEFPLDYDGPKDPGSLWEDKKYHYLTTVVISRRRIPQMRPWFPQWQLHAEWELVTEQMDFTKFADAVRAAGSLVGLGDARIKGMGRFTAEVKKA
jgi:hypothetical protein